MATAPSPTGEKCDDRNQVPGDGCSASCLVESGWKCPQPGQACVKVEICGDGVVQAGLNEQCDDGNHRPGDGCSASCTVEPGYDCSGDAGASDAGRCIRIWVCGNGKIEPGSGEACDDGNTVANDGCALDCSYVEPGWSCPKAADGTGGACTQAPTYSCGDAIVGGSEQCDDGNTVASDGCSDHCALETGYTCPNAGMACVPIAFCGDGKRNLDRRMR